jgi:hypothetical protein
MTTTKLDIILSYKGTISFEIIEDILSQFKDSMNEIEVDPVIKKRLFSIIVECMENTYRHKINMKKAGQYLQIELKLTHEDAGFLFEIGNYMNNENLTKLIERIEQVNSLDLDGLNHLYRQSISTARISDKGGAGLGLIEIARNSRHKINYSILEQNESISFFKFEIRISDDPNKMKVL